MVYCGSIGNWLFNFTTLYCIYALYFKNKNYHYKPLATNLQLNFLQSTASSKKNIAIAVDFSKADEVALNAAFELGGINATYTLIHIVETVGAILYGENIKDHETSIDKKLLQEYHELLTNKGFKIETKLGFGQPNKTIAEIVNQEIFDVLVMGTHGHQGIKDILFGTTVNKLRHKITIPLLIVKN